MADVAWLEITHDGGVQKVIRHHPPPEAARPKAGTRVIVQYEACVSSSGEVFDTRRRFMFTIGAGEVVSGLDRGVASMCVGEEATLRLSEAYAFGDQGCPPLVPPHAQVTFTVRLLRILPPRGGWEEDLWNVSDCLRVAQQAKEDGNCQYQEGNLQQACQYYRKVERLLGSRGTQDERIFALLLAGYLNLAAALLKRGMATRARTACDKALSLDPENVKALYRAGQASHSLGDLIRAEEDLKHALRLVPHERACEEELARVRSDLQARRYREHNLYRKMFQ